MVRLMLHHGVIVVTPWCDMFHTMVRLSTHYGVKTKIIQRFGEVFVAFPILPRNETCKVVAEVHKNLRRIRLLSVGAANFPFLQNNRSAQYLQREYAGQLPAHACRGGVAAGRGGVYCAPANDSRPRAYPTPTPPLKGAGSFSYIIIYAYA